MNKKLLAISSFVMVTMLFMSTAVVAGKPKKEKGPPRPDITALQESVDNNTAAISINATAIQQSTGDIQQNAADIQQNAESIGNFATLQWLANGQPIGSVVSHNRLLTYSDYLVIIERGENRVEEIAGRFWYVSTGCIGQKYLARGNYINSAQGEVGQSPHESDPVRLYYYPQGSIPVENVVFLSHTDKVDGCVDQNITQTGLPVFPNDPAITGITTEFFDLPLTMGHR